MNNLKVRWREHEMIFVTLAAGIGLAAYCSSLLSLSRDEILQQYAQPFRDNQVPFSILKNVVWPQVGTAILAYIAYLFINLFIIPKIFSKKNEPHDPSGAHPIGMHHSAKKIGKRIWLPVALVVFMAVVFGVMVVVSVYYLHEWQFHYPGFSIWFNPENPRSQLNTTSGFMAGVLAVAGYFLFACIRQSLIGFLEKSSRRSFRILLLNQITGFLVIFSIIPIFLMAFDFMRGSSFLSYYFSFGVACFILYLSNTYWLFPKYGQDGFVHINLITRLLISALIITLPFYYPLRREEMGLTGYSHSFIPLLVCQFFIVTPISWLIFQQRKDRILEMRGLETALVKSKASLDFLRSQINPHFLFNALNTLYGTALKEGAEHSATGIQKLGDMMRFMLVENIQSFIPMAKEIEYLENYISLQRLRTAESNTIIVEENISQIDCPHDIAPMLLIPMVENAFKHGISMTAPSWIKINLTCAEKAIHFSVRNSIHRSSGNDPESYRGGIGLENVRQRLQLIYPGKHAFNVRDDGNEFVAEIIIRF